MDSVICKKKNVELSMDVLYNKNPVGNDLVSREVRENLAWNPYMKYSSHNNDTNHYPMEYQTSY